MLAWEQLNSAVPCLLVLSFLPVALTALFVFTSLGQSTLSRKLTDHLDRSVSQASLSVPIIEAAASSGS